MISVSTHAAERFIERVEPTFTIAQAEEEILEQVKHMYKHIMYLGDGRYSLRDYDGYVAVVMKTKDRYTIVTIRSKK